MKRIVIIGASSGLGLQIATDFAEAGWTVGVAARRQEPLQDLQARWPERVFTSELDVTAPDAVGRFNTLIEQMEGMDICLYCSGVGFTDPQLTDAKIENTLNVNVVGFARIIAAAYRYFRDSDNPRRGQIAAITSIAGTKGIGIAASYSSSKRFQQMFLDSLRQLSHQQDVNVAITDIRPGFVRTDLLDSSRNYPMIMPVQYAARLIERAIIYQRRVAWIDLRWRLADSLWRAIPSRLWQRLRFNF